MENVVDRVEVSLRPDRKIVKASCESLSTEETLRLVEAEWSERFNRLYRPLGVQPCCEYCSHVGEAMWHCRNSESEQFAINVSPDDICSKYSPNEGLLMALHRAWFDKHMEDRSWKK